MSCFGLSSTDRHPQDIQTTIFPENRRFVKNFSSKFLSNIEYKGKWYFIYHNGAISTQGGSFRRSVCVDYL
jgi:hypothetical protein